VRQQFQFATDGHTAFPAAMRSNLSQSIGMYRHQAKYFDGKSDGKNSPGITYIEEEDV
jgi:hypothetical protein